jgi:hypothetical protein
MADEFKVALVAAVTIAVLHALWLAFTHENVQL